MREKIQGVIQALLEQEVTALQRRTREVGELLPTLYLHGLAQGDFELALRELLGDGAPLSLEGFSSVLPANGAKPIPHLSGKHPLATFRIQTKRGRQGAA